MSQLLPLLAMLAAAVGFTAAAVATVQLDSDTATQLKNLQQTVESLGRQMMQQQTFVEERIRSDGMSGIKTLRHQNEGTRPYYGDHHIGGSALSQHDHADYDRTIGLGESATTSPSLGLMMHTLSATTSPSLGLMMHTLSATTSPSLGLMMQTLSATTSPSLGLMMH
ncbi:hypothetical protein RRG08_064815, partial [Elysia crispata]